MDRIWIKLRRVPGHDAADGTVVYTWAWGLVDGPSINEPCTSEELIVCRPTGSITYAGEPDQPHCATPALCLLANHVRDTGELPDELRYVQPNLRESAPRVAEPQVTRRRPPERHGLGLGTLAERARR